MTLGTHNFVIGLSNVSQLPLHLFTKTLYGQNKASPTPSFKSSILGLGIHSRLTADKHFNVFTFNMLNKLIAKLINHIL